MRNYSDLTVSNWIDENQFIGTIMRTGEKYACYGWSKGKGFFIYIIVDGHIRKIGSVPRDVLVDRPVQDVVS